MLAAILAFFFAAVYMAWCFYGDDSQLELTDLLFSLVAFDKYVGAGGAIGVTARVREG